MVISSTSSKGQIVIPAPLRKKYHITPQTKWSIIDHDGEIILRPLKKGIVDYAKGLFKGGPSALKVLITERKRDRS